MKRRLPVIAALVAAGIAASVAALTGGTTTALPVPQPTVSDYQFISGSQTPPTQAQCNSVGRRCFGPRAIQAAYDVFPLYAQNVTGRGATIAIVDSWGSDTIAHDLHVFDQAFGIQPMCGEEGVTCASGMPNFTVWHPNGSNDTKPPQGNGTGQEDKSAWALEVSLDVETAHAMAPGANILLVAVTGSETLGVQGFPNMMKAEKTIVDNHMADVITQSFGSAEEAFGSPASLQNLRDAFTAAAASGVTVFASSGDFGTANIDKTPVGKGGSLIPYPTVQWPASDPLVTGVGGTYLCTDPNAINTRVVDSVTPPVNCQANPGQAEVGWLDAGGGFSRVFSKPAYQSNLPAGSTPIGSTRGVPDIGLQASSRTGALVYISLPPDGTSGLICGSSPCSTGWYDIGGTSLSAPQWAGLAALGVQIKGRGLGLINPALYTLASNPATYALDFYDVTVGNNQTDPSVPGYPATPGWDPITGLGTPNAAHLVPDLAALTP